MPVATEEALIEKIRGEVARRKGTSEAAALPPPQKKSMLQKAAAAIERAKTKHLRAKKWPRLLRPLRRNQEVINEALIAAAQTLTREVDYLSRLAPPLAIQQSRILTQVQQTVDYQRALGERIQGLETSRHIPQSSPEQTDDFYTAFEDIFRGSSDLIRQRLREDYQPLLQQIREHFSKAIAIDLGCGRGEWLEILKANGIEALGIDQNQRMVDHSRALGLEARQGDALEYLRTLPGESLTLVTGFHIAEHLEFPALLALITETHRILTPGGTAIFETPNPECQRVSTYTFYLDPTHRNPVPMELLTFIATHAGFSATRVERLHPYCENGAPQGHGDYAGIFTK